MLSRRKILRRLLIWRLKNIKDRQFIYVLSILVGLGAGFAAVIIKNLVHLIQQWLLANSTNEYFQFLYFLLPIVGIFLAILFIKYIVREPVRHGVPNVLYGISKNNGILKPHNIYSSVVTSALTVGFGGSVGLEGPTVATGAALGSNLGRFLRLNYRQITLLLGCAAAGAMAAIFKAPIAAIVFALEVIMLDLTMASLIPLLLASVTATLTSYLFLGQDVLYPFEVKQSFIMGQLPYYILLGILAGLVSVYFARVYLFVGGIFDTFKKQYFRLITGGVSLGIIIFIFPSLYGEGYQAINSALSGNIDFLFDGSIFESFRDSFIATVIILLLVVLFKVIATSATFGSGGVGGIFAPTLFMGVNTGLLFSIMVNKIGIKELPQENFALAGMAGLIAGVLHAPLTAIFLIGEITGGYKLFLPLMITAIFSYVTVRLFESHSVYTIQLAKRKELITHHKDKAVLSLMQVKNLIETNFSTVSPDATLGELVKVISKSVRNIFPVVDGKDNLLGIVFVNDIRHIVFKPELYHEIFVRDLMYMPNPVVDPDESMEEVAMKFQKSQQYNLPVLKDGKYLGFVSRAHVFSRYRELIRDFSED